MECARLVAAISPRGARFTKSFQKPSTAMTLQTNTKKRQSTPYTKASRQTIRAILASPDPVLRRAPREFKSGGKPRALHNVVLLTVVTFLTPSLPQLSSYRCRKYPPFSPRRKAFLRHAFQFQRPHCQVRNPSNNTIRSAPAEPCLCPG